MIEIMTTGEDRQLYLDIIMRSTERINKVIAELPASNSAYDDETEIASIHDLLDEVLVMGDDRIMLKHVAVRKDYSTVDCKIRMNKSKVIIALTNIVVNAIDAMYQNNGLLILVTKSVNKKCVMEIRDNGIGIPKRNIKNIFKSHFTSKPNGMTVGLATTRALLHFNRAEISVESKMGEGTRFTVSFDQIAGKS